MTPDDVRERLAELEQTATRFEIEALRAVLAALDGDQAEAARSLDMAALAASRGQFRMLLQIRRAISGSHQARIEIWIDGPGVMSPAGHRLLVAALLLLAGPP